MILDCPTCDYWMRLEFSFYAPQLYWQVLLRRVLAMGILSVCLSVRHGPVQKQPSDIETLGLHQPRVSSFQRGNFGAAGWGDSPRRRASKRGTPLRNRYFTTIGSSSTKKAADRHRLAAYHNKHCRRAFQWYQHRWPWMSLTSKIGFLGNF